MEGHVTEQELRDTIQHLAVQNMHLFVASRRPEQNFQQNQTRREVSIQTDVSILAASTSAGSVSAGSASAEYASESCITDVPTSAESTSAASMPAPCPTDVSMSAASASCVTDVPTSAVSTSAGYASASCLTDVSMPDTSAHYFVAENEGAVPTMNQHDFGGDVKCVELDENRGKRNKMEMDKFKEDLSNRREARHKAISAFSSELERLRAELNEEKLAREISEQALKEIRRQSGVSRPEPELARTQQELAEVKANNEEVSSENKRLTDENEELANTLKEEKLQYEQDQAYSQRRIVALKNVADLSKQMLAIRENQVSDLKAKIIHLEAKPKGNANNTQLQVEYDTQINNIKSLKLLYEDRMKIIVADKERFQRESEEKSAELSVIVDKCSGLESRLAELESTRSEQDEMKASLQTRLDMSLEESKGLSKEIALINNMFTQMLLGNSSSDLDLDKLTRLLQENHDLITEMTTKEDLSDTATSLPKLLWDLLNQIDKDENTPETTTSTTGDRTEEPTASNGETSSSTQDPNKAVTEEGTNSIAVEEIASNLPKVWKVLMELLSHHVAPTPSEDLKPSCYKCIDTPTGPQFVPSVSNTYIRLKDLILEKKSLQKDLGKLKQLNGHLESKLHEQEKRLLCVSAELRKTWGVVGRLRSQFKQLHTHEQILRYELQQKRHLLTELKKELEYCREKWEKARQKDKETEVEWKKLRAEFAARKLQDHSNSRESGFFDEKEVESGEDERSSRNSLPSPTATSEGEETLEESSTSTFSAEEQESGTFVDDHQNTEASDLSWITLVKLQCLFHSHQQTEDEQLQDTRALESIFSMPPIQIPFSHHQKLVEPCTQVTRISTDTPSPAPQSVSPNCEMVDSSAGHSSCRADNQVRDALGRTPEEVLEARAARLKRLEEQTQLLFKKVTRTTNRSVALSNRLEELHEQYGVPNPPPLPQTLPAMRLPVEVSQPTPSRPSPPPPTPHDHDTTSQRTDDSHDTNTERM